MEVVFIIVAVQKGLEDIKNALQNRGYEAVVFGEYNYPIDAIIYSENLMQLSYISVNNMPHAVSGLRTNYGVFMIDSKGKSINEIDNMLKNRCYSPLF